MILNNWFECKVKMERQVEGGMLKRVQDTYLVDAMSFAEAEDRILKELTPLSAGGIEVVDLKRAKYGEMFESSDSEADKWYKVKCQFITLDEKSGKEKKVSTLFLVQAADLRGAVSRFEEGMKGSMMDYTIHTIQETPIMDVFPYQAKS